MSRAIVSTEDVIGVKVKNTQNEDLGEIEAIMLDKPTGQVAYVVLSYGGIFGLGDKLFALPWNILSYDASSDCFRIPLNKEQLKNSPGFDKNHWPDMSSATFKESIHNYYIHH